MSARIPDHCLCHTDCPGVEEALARVLGAKTSSVPRLTHPPLEPNDRRGPAMKRDTDLRSRFLRHMDLPQDTDTSKDPILERVLLYVESNANALQEDLGDVNLADLQHVLVHVAYRTGEAVLRCTEVQMGQAGKRLTLEALHAANQRWAHGHVKEGQEEGKEPLQNPMGATTLRSADGDRAITTLLASLHRAGPQGRSIQELRSDILHLRPFAMNPGLAVDQQILNLAAEGHISLNDGWCRLTDQGMRRYQP